MTYFFSLIIFSAVSGFFISVVGIPHGFEWLNPLMICVIAGLSFAPLIFANGIYGVWILFMFGLIGFVIEYIAITTCYPYGCFEYSSLLGHLINNTVPWTVFFVRSPLIIGISSLLKPYTNILFVTQDSRMRKGLFFFFSTIILVLCDMVLDPGAVLFGFWTFVGTHSRYNVPWSNFAGWIVSGLFGFMIRSYRLDGYKKITGNKRTTTRYDADALLVMILFWTTVGWINMLRGPAVIGTILSFIIGYGVAKAKGIIFYDGGVLHKN